MDIIVMRNSSFYSDVVKKFTKSDYTHVAGVIDDEVYDFCINGKQIRKLEDYLNSNKLLNLDCIRDVDIDPEEFKNRFEDASMKLLGVL